jgi:enamine deaminase RidA (YjgF/YER057c/UK114 family)
MPRVETSTPRNTPKPIGPYSHIAKVGAFISIGGTAGVDPATGQLRSDVGLSGSADPRQLRSEPHDMNMVVST